MTSSAKFLFSILGFALFTFAGCKEKTANTDFRTNTSYSEFVRGYTSGVIESDQGVEVHFMDIEGLGSLKQMI